MSASKRIITDPNDPHYSPTNVYGSDYKYVPPMTQEELEDFAQDAMEAQTTELLNELMSDWNYSDVLHHYLVSTRDLDSPMDWDEFKAKEFQDHFAQECKNRNKSHILEKLYALENEWDFIFDMCREWHFPHVHCEWGNCKENEIWECPESQIYY